MDELSFSRLSVSEPDLLLRPFPGRQEGPQGYLLRLAEANCLPVSDLAQLGIRYDVAWLMRHRLLPDPALDPDLHTHVGRMAHWSAHTGRIWNQRYVRFCPLCLVEEPVWRAGGTVHRHRLQKSLKT